MKTAPIHMRAELLDAAVGQPRLGQVVVPVLVRFPYASMPSRIFVDISKLSAATLAAVSEPSIATTSASVGAANSESAMDFAVLRRSYVSIAAVISDSRARLLRIFKRASKASVASMGIGSSESAHGSEPKRQQTIVLSGPQGSGKTRIAQHLQRIYGCSSIVDEWQPSMQLTPGALHVTSSRPSCAPFIGHTVLYFESGWEPR